jgi:hypothetical protein
MSEPYSDFGEAGGFTNFRRDPTAPSAFKEIQDGFSRMGSLLKEMHNTAKDSPDYKMANQKYLVAQKAANKEFNKQMEINTRGIEAYTRGQYAPEIHKEHVEDLTKASISAGRKIIPSWLDRSRAYVNNFMTADAAADLSRLSISPANVGIMHPAGLPTKIMPAAELAVVHSLVSSKKADM